MPIGTLMNSVQRHEPRSVTTPPSIRPRVPPPDETAREEGERPVAGGLVGCAGGEQGEHAGRGERRADALEGAGARPAWPGLGEPADQRGDGEDRQAELEDPEPAEDVAEPTAEEQQPAEGEGVGVEHPRQRRRAEAEVGVDAGEGDVHDRRVEHQHQLGDEDDRDAGGGAAGVGGELGGESADPADRVAGEVCLEDMEVEVLFWPDGPRYS